ncbi:hypothetical protein TNIN_490631 [Trichonephila inaurata madagascariensis]|uniref:Uncharacterized protein n=1 Tax=Trichonephila inaurata madagascariensis TaxID=2747483 RepID=A0A8X6X1A4_9ARAC|nr:hypothetical protein TNIN_490631 [Trichonephila inaurata madagascariensis]
MRFTTNHGPRLPQITQPVHHPVTLTTPKPYNQPLNGSGGQHNPPSSSQYKKKNRCSHISFDEFPVRVPPAWLGVTRFPNHSHTVTIYQSWLPFAK